MTTFYTIPLTGAAEHFAISLSGNTYQLLFRWRAAPMAGWVLDIFSEAGARILCGVPLVTGADLLGQYAYLNFNGSLMVFPSDGTDNPPTFDNLATATNLVWITEP